MCKILLSINPEYVEQIFLGNKSYEYRKAQCKRNVDKIVIYATYPMKKVVGEAEVIDVLEMEKEELWRVTQDTSGISKEFYDEYYQKKEKAVAYKLGKITKYEQPQTLDEIGIRTAPQSYMYLPEVSAG